MSEIPVRLAPDQLEWLAAITIATQKAAAEGDARPVRIALLLPGVIQQMRQHGIIPPA
ncbi:hypothetical protein [Azospirillum agricola]|uniref:hypothetical protein n=1 Tax=Azospirillum agricola TaxID=1720247 RepID=UPI0015C479E2|nr:hypothetical protein [Azospirillum agricola]